MDFNSINLTPEQQKGLLYGSLLSSAIMAIAGGTGKGGGILRAAGGAAMGGPVAYAGGLDEILRQQKVNADLAKESEAIQASQAHTAHAGEELAYRKQAHDLDQLIRSWHMKKEQRDTAEQSRIQQGIQHFTEEDQAKAVGTPEGGVAGPAPVLSPIQRIALQNTPTANIGGLWERILAPTPSPFVKLDLGDRIAYGEKGKPLTEAPKGTPPAVTAAEEGRNKRFEGVSGNTQANINAQQKRHETPPAKNQSLKTYVNQATFETKQVDVNDPGALSQLGGDWIDYNSAPNYVKTMVATNAQEKAKQTATKGFPPASEHKGESGTDTASGKRYQSNGKEWVEIKK